MFPKLFLTSLTLFSLSVSVQAATLPGATELNLNRLFVNDVPNLFNGFNQNSPISITLNPGALGLPNPNTYLQQLAQPINQLNLQTIFSGNGGNQSLTGILQTLDFTEDSFLLDVALDGQTIFTGNDTNFTESVVLPFGLLDKYFQLGLSDFVREGAIENALSETAQQRIINTLIDAHSTEDDNQQLADNSLLEADDSNFILSSLDNSGWSNDLLATQSNNLALASQTTDTSFQLLRNISTQLGIDSRQQSHSSNQLTQLGKILGNQSTQFAQQSRQFQAQQETATQFLETAKQQQILHSMQAVTQAEQLKITTEHITANQRLSQAPLNQASTISGVFLIPLSSND